MEITINLLEAASNIANKIVIDFFGLQEYSEEEIENILLEESRPGVLTYKKEYQAKFDSIYEFVYKELEKCQIVDIIIKTL